MNDSTDKSSGSCEGRCNCDYTLAFLVLRGWLAVRAILTGMEDPSGAMVDVKVKVYALTNYSGIPPVFKDKFANEPLMPHSLLVPFEHLLGPALIATGIMLLLGIGTRLSLFIQGLIYIMLTIGFILIRQDDGISWLGIHVALVALALVLAKHNKLALLKKW